MLDLLKGYIARIEGARKHPRLGFRPGVVFTWREIVRVVFARLHRTSVRPQSGGNAEFWQKIQLKHEPDDDEANDYRNIHHTSLTSSISKRLAISATPRTIAMAEQYRVSESSIARRTASGSMLAPRTRYSTSSRR